MERQVEIAVHVTFDVVSHWFERSDWTSVIQEVVTQSGKREAFTLSEMR